MGASNLITTPFPLPNRNIARVSNSLSLEGGNHYSTFVFSAYPLPWLISQSLTPNCLVWQTKKPFVTIQLSLHICTKE